MKRRFFEHRTAMLRANIAIVGSVMAFGAAAQDRAEIDRAQIIGNRELPKVLYIVPWKKPLPGDLAGRPAVSVLDEARNSGEVQDATNNAVNIVEAARVQPTGQHTEVPRAVYDKAPGPDVGLPDLVFSVVATAVAAGEVVARARERRRRRREGDVHT